MLSPKSTLCVLLYSLHVTTSHETCKLSFPEDDSYEYYYVKKSEREALCARGFKVCCPDGCCPENLLLSILWKISMTILFIFIGVIICIYGFYYFYEKIMSVRKDDMRCSTSTQMQIFNVENRNPSAPVDTRPDVRSHRITPPPPYNDAVLLPAVHGERVPSYAEAMRADVEKKRF